MENFKNKLRTFISDTENYANPKKTRILKIAAFFTACGAVVVGGFVLSLIWNSLALFIGLEVWPAFDAMRDISSFLGVFLLYDLIVELKGINDND